MHFKEGITITIDITILHVANANTQSEHHLTLRIQSRARQPRLIFVRVAETKSHHYISSFLLILSNGNSFLYRDIPSRIHAHYLDSASFKLLDKTTSSLIDGYKWFCIYTILLRGDERTRARWNIQRCLCTSERIS